MGALFKATATKPLPAGAKIIVRKGKRMADSKTSRRNLPPFALTQSKGKTRQNIK
jgi:hypothetical protein